MASAGRSSDRIVEMVDPLVRRVLGVAHEPLEEAGGRADERQEERGPEARLKPVWALAICRAGSAPSQGDVVGAVREHQEAEHGADDAEAEIAEEHPLGGCGRTQGEPERDEARTHVGAEHESERQRHG